MCNRKQIMDKLSKEIQDDLDQLKKLQKQKVFPGNTTKTTYKKENHVQNTMEQQRISIKKKLKRICKKIRKTFS